MTKEREIECKNLVTESEFRALLSHFNIGGDNFFRQTNHYFDTPSFFLKGHHSALRLRKLDDRNEITLKIPADVGLFEITQLADEEQAAVFLDQASLPDGDVKEELRRIGTPLHQLTCFGALETSRAELRYENGLLVFDHSRYLGQDDYEIEYEVEDWEKGKEIFRRLLKKFNIRAEQADNKVERFYRAKLAAQNKGK